MTYISSDKTNSKRKETLSDLVDKNQHSILSEFWGLLITNKKWWLAPIIIMLLLLSLLIIISGSPVAPFIYTLF